MAKHNPGDKIRIITKDRQLEGTLMPRPDILDKDITVIKLDNGYNIGIKKSEITKTELLTKHKETKKKKLSLKKNKNLPTVPILSCGGTISSRIDYKTGAVSADYTAEDFVAMCPELENIANLKVHTLMQKMSEDFDFKDWQLMAKQAVKEINNGAAGIIITQGTDIMHFSSAALAFFIKNLTKPIIFTAAQRSIDRGSSDAFMNLTCAVTAAAKADIAEVMTCMHGTTSDDYCLLIRGTNVRKMHTSRRDAFRPINELPLAKVYNNGKIETVNKDYNKRNNKEKCELDDKFEPKIALIQIHPHFDPDIIDHYIKKKYKGIVIAATALGHVPTDHPKLSIIPKLERAIKQKIPVIISSQTLYGKVHPLVYTNLRKLSLELNCIFVENIHPETAFIKLGWVLAKTKNPKEVKKLMQTNIKGEITEREDPKTFLY